MKKIMILLLTFLVVFLSACSKKEIKYTNDDRLVLNVASEDFKILQITDLHLTYGFDHQDKKTYELIRALNDSTNPDLIIVTGDIVMTPSAKRLFKDFVTFMNDLATPWTFIFGNHETDYHDYIDFQNYFNEVELFKVGPNIKDGGVGNFIIDVYHNGNVLTHLYFFDTKSDRKDGVIESTGYDFLSVEQLNWYEKNILNDNKNSYAFMHIPLIEYEIYEGIGKGEDIYHQDINTGFFDLAKNLGKTKGVFVGHDHNNEFSFMHEGIVLAYGKTTGYNAYGKGSRGARLITFKEDVIINNDIILDSEVIK